MSIWTEPRECSQCGAFAPWQIAAMDGDGESSLARSCDDDLADVLRGLPDVQPVVIEVLPVEIPEVTCVHDELEPHPCGPDPAVDWCDGPTSGVSA